MNFIKISWFLFIISFTYGGNFILYNKQPAMIFINYWNIICCKSNTTEKVPLSTSSQVPTTKLPLSVHVPAYRKFSSTPTEHKNWGLINDEKCGSSSENRIIGGRNASLGQYPWIAQIGYIKDDPKKLLFRCGGSLINTKYVITAAHCTINLQGNLKIQIVRLGEYDTSTDIDCLNDVCADKVKDYNIEGIIVHKFYGQERNTNDIALLKLEGTVEYTTWISPICLPFGELLQKNLTNNIVEVAGWGLIETTNPNGSIVLQTVKLPVISSSICKKKYRRKLIDEDQQLCVGGEVGKDSCNGDSGGPLMKVEAVGDLTPRYYLYGVVSYGPNYCGLSSAPAVYTKVGGYLPWILNQLTDT